MSTCLKCLAKCEAFTIRFKTLTRRSPKPYVDQCETRDEKTYTKERCVEECLQKLTLDRCGCCDPTSILLDNSRVCNLFNATEVCCMDKVLTDLNYDIRKCNCPLPCLQIHYQAQISSAQLLHRHRGSRTDVENHIKLCVYYRNTDSIELNSIPKNDVDGTVSNIGGLVGLWLGASALSIFTLIPQIVKMIRRFVSPKEFVN
ncbi:degenerin mec-10-like [Tachypleus tridentatus]|uniref:degenerin mec-10-like n=1 Tax=Tachypleus tridentatus TaxID=6853 RepID=UPI003FD37BF4